MLFRVSSRGYASPNAHTLTRNDDRIILLQAAHATPAASRNQPQQHESSTPAEQRIERAIEASPQSESCREGHASTSSKSYQRSHALTQAVPRGAAHLDCVRRMPTRTRKSGLTMSGAPEPETSFFGHFLFSLLKSATCTSSDCLPMNESGGVLIAFTNRCAVALSQGSLFPWGAVAGPVYERRHTQR